MNELKKISKIFLIGSSPRWLGIKDACAHANIGKETLKSLIDAGLIKGFQDPNDKRGTWHIDRQSIDLYYEGLCNEENNISNTIKKLGNRLK